MPAPFVDAGMPEVCARIVFRLIARKYRSRPPGELSGALAAQLVLDDLEPLKGSLIHSCALAALAAIISRKQLARWRDDAVRASRLGKGFRRCWYAEYKAGRGDDPRVTNRGVMDQASFASTVASAELTKRTAGNQ